MAKFVQPPLRTPLVTDDGTVTPVWQRHLVAVTDRLTQPNVPVLITPPTTGVPGDIRTDGAFVYVCVATNTWKKAALA